MLDQRQCIPARAPRVTGHPASRQVRPGWLRTCEPSSTCPVSAHGVAQMCSGPAQKCRGQPSLGNLWRAPRRGLSAGASREQISASGGAEVPHSSSASSASQSSPYQKTLESAQMSSHWTRATPARSIHVAHQLVPEAPPLSCPATACAHGIYIVYSTHAAAVALADVVAHIYSGPGTCAGAF